MATDREDPREVAGIVVAIGYAVDKGGPLADVAEVSVMPGVGIPSDRYGRGGGTWQKSPDREITFIEVEAAEAAGVANPLLLRRNVVTRGIRLDGLIGRRFRVGEATCEGVRRCDPCGYLENLTMLPGLKAALDQKGGLRARVLVGGTVRRGDSIRIER